LVLQEPKISAQTQKFLLLPCNESVVLLEASSWTVVGLVVAKGLGPLKSISQALKTMSQGAAIQQKYKPSM
jgi:hypothetical protein